MILGPLEHLLVICDFGPRWAVDLVLRPGANARARVPADFDFAATCNAEGINRKLVSPRRL